MSASITEAAVRARMHTARPGQRLVVLPQTDSTNSEARRLAEAGAPAGTAVIADRQSAGRGRRGRSFYSPAGGVYLSIILRTADAAQIATVTARAAVATARAIEGLCDAPVTVKWVNDLFIGRRKICGILAEAAIDPGAALPRYTVLGIGVNVEAVDFPPEVAAVATSLAREGYAVDRAALAAAILEEWARLEEERGPYLEEYRRRSAVLGQTVTVLRGGESYTAVAEEITDDAHLIVRRADGTRQELSSGEVSIRLP